MGCTVSINEVTQLWYKPVEQNTVIIYLSEQRKCYFCKKGFGHSFARVSTCCNCNLIAHSKCINDRIILHPLCPVCYPE